MTIKRLLPALATVLLTASCGVKDGEYCLHILSTNDTHSAWFDSSYVDGRTKASLFAVKHYVDSIRAEYGPDNVMLIDAGDCLQGDNAAYYYNYVDTLSPHVFPRLAEYMGYDAVTVGNHDIEAGHSVYDRISRDLAAKKIPFLAGNTVRTDGNGTYFPSYAIVKRAGLKVAVLGFTNANIKAWLSEEQWKGMDFLSLLSCVQDEVDRVQAKEKPHVTIVAVHSGTGNGDGSILESQGLDLFNSLHGVDFLFCSHDHRPHIEKSDDICLINAGSRSHNLGHGQIKVTVKDGKVVSRELEAEMIDVEASKADPKMREAFRPEYEAVKAFTLQEVGRLDVDLQTELALGGMCDYMNMIHTLTLRSSGADISFAAPLTQRGTIKAGTLVFNDLFTLYPFENQLYVLNLSGQEIKNYLEYSYEGWVNVWTPTSHHVLKLAKRPDKRSGKQRYGFAGATFNLDSAAGIVYEVDITKPFGERVNIISLADGRDFEMDAMYKVAMTSYRASGGGALLPNGAGVDSEEMERRVVSRHPELRKLLLEWLKECDGLGSEDINDPALLGGWKFVPEKKAAPAVAKDLRLLYPHLNR